MKFVTIFFHVIVVGSRDGAIFVLAVETLVKPLGNFLTFKNHLVRSWVENRRKPVLVILMRKSVGLFS